MLSEELDPSNRNIDRHQYNYECHKFYSAYCLLLKRALKTPYVPRGKKLDLFGAKSWGEAMGIMKNLEGFNTNLQRSGMRLEVINASLPMPELVHHSNLKYGKRYRPRKLRGVKLASMKEEAVRELVRVIDLAIEIDNQRICAKKLHTIARKCLNMRTNAPIVNTIRIIMTAKGWKAWQTIDGCWYEKL